MDADGNAIAVWAHVSGVTYAARFARVLESWLLPTIIAGSAVASPKIALNAAGDGQAVWVRTVGTQNLVEAMLYSAGSRTWTGPTVLSAEGSAYPALDVAADTTGNALAVWSQAYVRPCGYLCLQGARYVAAARMWSLTDDLSHPLQAAYNPQVQFDGHGNAVTVWGQSFMGYSATQARTWRATPSAPTLTGVTAAPGTLTLAFLPPERAKRSSPPRITPTRSTTARHGQRGTRRRRRRRSWSAVCRMASRIRCVFARSTRPGPPAKVMAVAGAGPQTPSGLVTSSVTGNRVTLEWAPPSAGLAAAAYVVEGGLTPGEVLASLPTGSEAPRFMFVAPTGAFYVRVHAVTDGVRSGPSNEIFLVVNLSTPPSAPAGLLGLVDGAGVALSWTNTFAGGAPASLWLIVTGAVTTVLPLPMGESFTYANVPAGTYTLAVVAANAGGVRPPSNAVTLAFPGRCGGSPQAATNVRAWRDGSIISMSWSPPASGPAVSHYLAQVSGAYVGGFATTGRILSGAAAKGTYTLSVAAANACGTGVASATHTVTVP